MKGATAIPIAVAMRYCIDGMDCPSCAIKIETAQSRLGGMDNVGANYQTQTLALRLDEAAIPRTTIEAQVRGLGFDIQALEPLQVRELAGIQRYA